MSGNGDIEPDPFGLLPARGAQGDQRGPAACFMAARSQVERDLRQFRARGGAGNIGRAVAQGVACQPGAIGRDIKRDRLVPVGIESFYCLQPCDNAYVMLWRTAPEKDENPDLAASRECRVCHVCAAPARESEYPDTIRGKK